MLSISLKTRFFSGLIIVSVLLVVSTLSSGLMLRSAMTSLERLSTHAIPASQAAMGAAQTGAQIAADIPLLAGAQDGYVRQAAQIALQQKLTLFRQHLSDLRQLGGHDGITERIAILARTLESEASHINALVHRLSDLRNGNGRDTDTGHDLTTALAASVERARAASVKLSSFVHREVTRYQAETQRQIEETRQATARMQTLVLVLGGGLIFIVMPFLWGYLGVRVIQRIADLAALARRLAAGDLSGPLPARSRDEIGDLAEGLGMAREAMIELRESNEILRRQSNDLQRMAATDPLTGVANRRRFKEAAEAELERSRRHNKSLAILVMDLDHFKRVNDHFGHDAGDRVLVRTAELLSRSIRASDVLSRHGGEEFILLLPEESLDAAHSLADRICATIAGESLVTPRGDTVRWTVSIGVASLRPEDQCIEDLVRRADAAMYRAKSAGRNRAEAAA